LVAASKRKEKLDAQDISTQKQHSKDAGFIRWSSYFRAHKDILSVIHGEI
jgi:hypothetical protein